MSLKARLDEIASGELRESAIAFSDSFLGDEGCTALVLALQNNTTVTSLDLRGCNIRSEGASSLAQFLASNTTLVSLGLEWNGVGMIESGIQALCKVYTQLRSYQSTPKYLMNQHDGTCSMQSTAFLQ